MSITTCSWGLGMVKTKPLEYVVGKWQKRVEVATPDYEFGIKHPREDWASATKAAESAWREGVQKAIAEGRFVKGVEAAGTKKWQEKALTLGVRRYPEGVRAALNDYKAKMAKVLEILAGIELPPRGPRGDPKNIERVRIIAEVLHRAKIEGRI